MTSYPRINKKIVTELTRIIGPVAKTINRQITEKNPEKRYRKLTKKYESIIGPVAKKAVKKIKKQESAK